MSAAPALDNSDGIDFTPLEFTEFAIRLKGKSISLDKRPWLHPIYDIPMARRADGEFRRKVLLVFGRQCEKSTTLANMAMAMANIIPYLRILYVTASNDQMREFSDDKLRAIITDSPVLKRLAGQSSKGSKETQNVQTKRWTNQSKIVLRSVYRSPDRARGISSDMLDIDEIQDIYTDHLPVIEEVLFRSEIEGGPLSIYSGTPKTFDNALEFYWARHSTQNEWVVKCEGCRKWNVIDDVNIGPLGLECSKCRKELNPIANAQWARMGREENEWEGFRLPQPVALYAYRHIDNMFKRQWKGLMDKQRRYPRARFANEVMARSYDAGSKPVTFDEVRRCCLPENRLVFEPDNSLKAAQTWAGVDWGTGDESFTILSIWKYDRGSRFTMVFAKKYEGIESDPDHSVQDIIKWCRRFNVTRIGADWGFGFYPNAQLQKVFGANKVVLYQHVGKQKDKVKYDKSAFRFTTHRTRVLQDVFTLIKTGPKTGGIAFANWDESEKFMNDILAVYSDYSDRTGELRFDHPRGVPDDFIHTLCYALLVSQFEHRRPDLHSPSPKSKFRT
jgi:hypothetical protein